MLGMLRKECWGQGRVGKGASQEGTAIIQEGDGGGLDLGGHSEYDEKWSGYGYFKGRTRRIC